MSHTELTAGTIYASPQDGGYSVTKIYVLDDSTAFIMSYRDRFDAIPEHVSTADLQPFFFAPVVRDGLESDLVVLGVEPVTDAEMQTYQDHLDLQSQGYQ